MASIIKRMLGLDGVEDEVEHKVHRKALKEALKKQHEASQKAETTLVDLLSKSAMKKSES